MMCSDLYKNALIMLKKVRILKSIDFFLVLARSAAAGSSGTSAGRSDFTIKMGE